MDIHAHQLDYLAQARWHHFNFCFGSLESLDRSRPRDILWGPWRMSARRSDPAPHAGLRHSGDRNRSVANTFGVPGVAEHAYALESAVEADRFHRRLINACFQANYRPASTPGQLRVVIVGAGATGVELAAELHNTTEYSPHTAFKTLNRSISSISPFSTRRSRILPMLPERIAQGRDRGA